MDYSSYYSLIVPSSPTSLLIVKELVIDRNLKELKLRLRRKERHGGDRALNFEYIIIFLRDEWDPQVCDLDYTISGSENQSP